MFNEHGGFKVVLQDDVLFVTVTGAWNAETANAYKDVIHKTIAPLKGTFWGLISDVSAWELCTPDCELIIVELSAHCREEGLKREAMVNKSTESIKLELFHKHLSNNTPESPPHVFHRHFVKSQAEAKEWLMQQGYGLY